VFAVVYMGMYYLGFFGEPFWVWRCRLTASKPVLKAPMVSPLEATI
jgi:hypothetical protein